MITVHVILRPAGGGKPRELARMKIANTGEGADTHAHYEGETYRGRDAAALNRGTITRSGRVENFLRKDLHVWTLVAMMLQAMGYDR